MESNEFVEALSEGVSGPAELHAKLVTDATTRANSGDQTIAATGRRDIEWLILLGQLFAPSPTSDTSRMEMLDERITSAVNMHFALANTVGARLDAIEAKLVEVAEAAEGKETKVSADIKDRLAKVEEAILQLTPASAP